MWLALPPDAPAMQLAAPRSVDRARRGSCLLAPPLLRPLGYSLLGRAEHHLRRQSGTSLLRHPGTTSPPSSGHHLSSVIPGLDPGIHAAGTRWTAKAPHCRAIRSPRAWLWIPGSSPGMTESVVGVLARRTGDAVCLAALAARFIASGALWSRYHLCSVHRYFSTASQALPSPRPTQHHPCTVSPALLLLSQSGHYLSAAIRAPPLLRHPRA
ncbi:UNVERIFIED_ORG: hypothetical protein GGE64_004500 [Rhizobium etli]